MKRTVSVLVRNFSGALTVVRDRVAVDCDDSFAGIDALVEAQKKDGARAVLVLLDDDSVCRHWTLSGS